MSCSNEAESPEITTISFQSSPSTSIEELIDSYEVILLSEEEAFLLKKPQKIQIVDGKIFMLDRNNMSGRILIFDRQGKGLRAIDKPGKGPGEYVQIVDFDISPEERSIVIADAVNKKVLHYNFDGQHLHSSKVDHWIKNINVLENSNGKAKLIATSPIGSQSTSTGDNYDLFIHDQEMILENKYLPFSKPNEAGMGNGFNMYETSDGLSFYRSFTNHVYRVNRRGDYSQKYVVQFPAPILPSSRVMDHMMGAVPMNDFVYFVSFFENQDHLIFTYSWDNKNYLSA